MMNYNILGYGENYMGCNPFSGNPFMGSFGGGFGGGCFGGGYGGSCFNYGFNNMGGYSYGGFNSFSNPMMNPMMGGGCFGNFGYFGGYNSSLNRAIGKTMETVFGISQVGMGIDMINDAFNRY